MHEVIATFLAKHSREHHTTSLKSSPVPFQSAAGLHGDEGDMDGEGSLSLPGLRVSTQGQDQEDATNGLGRHELLSCWCLFGIIQLLFMLLIVYLISRSQSKTCTKCKSSSFSPLPPLFPSFSYPCLFFLISPNPDL